MSIPWWVWVVAGLGLTLLELLVPSFFLLWFGVSALMVGFVVWLSPDLSLAAQLSLWILLCVLLVFAWFRVFKPDDRTRTGQSDSDAVGEIGLLVGPIAPFERGRVRFQQPILGSEEWACMADEPLAAGTRVRVICIEGQFLKVERT
jgi:inner membrane protein